VFTCGNFITDNGNQILSMPRQKPYVSGGGAQWGESPGHQKRESPARAGLLKAKFCG